MKKNNWYLGLLLGIFGVSCHSDAIAGGFQVRLHSTPLIGTAYAGNAAIGGELSAMEDNPANMAYLMSSQIAATATPVWPTIKFRTDAGVSVRDAGVSAVVPAGYVAKKINDRWTVGLSMTSPFGLKTDYPASATSPVRGHNVLSELTTHRFTPSVSFKINDYVSIGLGIQAMYSNAELTRYATGVSPLLVRVKGHGWGVGGIAGLIVQPCKSTRFGLVYNSNNKTTVRGNRRIDAIGQRLAASADIQYPGYTTLSVHHDINSQWAVMASVIYTNWNRFKEIRIKTATQADAVTTYNWRNTWFWSVGGSYKPTDRWIVRAGVGLDQTPAGRDNLRTPGIPDSRRKWVSVGAGFKATSCIELAASYTHEFVSRARSELVDPVRGNVSGDYNQHVDFVSFEIKYKF